MTNLPTARDRHTAVVHNNNLYVFGGFDGSTRKNDFHVYSFEKQSWSEIHAPNPPSARHSHCCVVYEGSMYIFGGYDSSYKNDMHEFNFETGTWTVIHCSGKLPRSRYRATCVVHNDCMIMFGGHDGTRHLNDVNVFNFTNLVWTPTLVEGYNPIPRDSHVAVVYGDSMFIYGGSTGTATDDFQELRLFSHKQMWVPIRLENSSSTVNTASPGFVQQGTGNNYSPVRGERRELRLQYELTHDDLPTASYENGQNQRTMGSGNLMGFSRTGFRGMAQPPTPPMLSMITNNQNNNNNNNSQFRQTVSAESLPGLRFCHVAAVYKDTLYVFGGYDGITRLGDFIKFQFGPAPIDGTVPPSTLVPDLQGMLDNKELSDIIFNVEGIPIYAHKVLCARCPVLKAMLTGEMVESRSDEINIPEVRHNIFLGLLEYLYTDQTQITLDNAMEMFQVADRFGVDRLKRLCENLMLSSLNVENASHILYAADVVNATCLRERCLALIVAYFNEVSKSSAFEEVCRVNNDLLFEILKRR